MLEIEFESEETTSQFVQEPPIGYIPPKEKENFNIPPVTFRFEGDTPVAVEWNGNIHPLTAQERRYLPAEIPEDDRERLDKTVATWIEWDGQLWDITTDEILMATADRPGAELSKKGIRLRKKLDEAATPLIEAESRELAEALVNAQLARTEEIAEHDVIVGGQGRKLSFRRLIIGPTTQRSERDWAPDARILQAALFGNQMLGQEAVKDLRVFSLTDPDCLDEREREWEHSISNATGISGGHLADANTVISFSTAERQLMPQDGECKAVDLEEINDIHAHEAAHSATSGYDNAALREGIAVCIEDDFDFELLKRQLRWNQDYTREITREKMEALFSDEIENLPTAEHYYLSGAFLAHAYHVLGMEKFRDLMDLLSGERVAVRSKNGGVYELRRTSKRRKKYGKFCEDNLTGSLSVVLHETEAEGDPVDKFYAEFLEAINKPERYYLNGIRQRTISSLENEDV